MNVIFISDFIHLFHVSNPVHIKMIERKTPVFVFLHDRKGRTYNILTYSKSVRKPFCKNRLADAKIPFQSKDISALGRFADFFSELKRLLL